MTKKTPESTQDVMAVIEKALREAFPDVLIGFNRAGRLLLADFTITVDFNPPAPDSK
jgi:hypothetical protein